MLVVYFACVWETSTVFPGDEAKMKVALADHSGY
jgi:hypothetical protein